MYFRFGNVSVTCPVSSQLCLRHGDGLPVFYHHMDAHDPNSMQLPTIRCHSNQPVRTRHMINSTFLNSPCHHGFYTTIATPGLVYIDQLTSTRNCILLINTSDNSAKITCTPKIYLPTQRAFVSVRRSLNITQTQEVLAFLGTWYFFIQQDALTKFLFQLTKTPRVSSITILFWHSIPEYYKS